MKYMIAAIVLANFSSFGVCKDMRIPTCEEAAVSMSDYGESGDCLYSYDNAKTLFVDKTNGVITCQATMSRQCPDMPDENIKGEIVKFTAEYGIVTKQIQE